MRAALLFLLPKPALISFQVSVELFAKQLFDQALDLRRQDTKSSKARPPCARLVRALPPWNPRGLRELDLVLSTGS